MTVLKVGIIGCGRIAQLVHLRVLTRLPGVEVVALAEPDPQRREEARRRVPGALVFTDYEELLAIPAVQAVVICVPNALHAQTAVAALQARKHVYLEKPLATSLDEAQRVLAAWQDAGTVGMIGFNYRYHALYQAARQHIRAGRLGELVSARSVFSAATRTLPAWKQTRQQGGGVLLDLASHHIDLVHFLFRQNVCGVFAGLRSQRSEGDCAILHLQLPDGLLIQSFFALNAVEEDRFEIYGHTGKLMIDRYRSLNIEISGSTRRVSRLGQLGHGLRTLISSPYVREKIIAPAREPSYRAALAHFVAAVQSHRRASPDFWDGYRSLAIIEAAEASAKTGQVVSLTELANENFAR